MHSIQKDGGGVRCQLEKLVVVDVRTTSVADVLVRRLEDVFWSSRFYFDTTSSRPVHDVARTSWRHRIFEGRGVQAGRSTILVQVTVCTHAVKGDWRLE